MLFLVYPNNLSKNYFFSLIFQRKARDQEEIKKIAQKYGFSTHTDARKTQNGAHLSTIKKRRNELAHGFKSFKDCGKAKTFQEMRQIKDQSLLYVEQILKNMDDFLKKKHYLKKK